jgi:hypothetical protein
LMLHLPAPAPRVQPSMSRSPAASPASPSAQRVQPSMSGSLTASPAFPSAQRV